MKRYWAHIVTSTEKRVEEFLRGQVRDENREDRGRLESDIMEGKPTVYLLTDCLCLYFCEESRYCRSEELWEAVLGGVGFLERWQREDGSMDYPSCNFFSAPDTAFCFRRLFGAWQLLDRYGTSERELALKDRYYAMMVKCEQILLYGGFHTPNHRWAVTAALLCMAKLEEDEEKAGQLKKRARQYLAEGIDGDEDGEYAERSTGNYNAVVDKSLLLAWESTGDESFLKYVGRNLTAMLYYIDGDDTIFTQNSTRQDHGKKLYPDQYFYLYTWMAQRNGSAVFDAAAHKMIRDNRQRGDLAPDCMF
ncbi:MAG: hypothetical protein LUE87_10105, partial [Lachnospiraceae bacterium]|nr:hypothetical protein [Lachnospiraceae bacterium]